MKNVAILLAGGTGKRMGNLKLPKQFLEICNIPVIILTLKRILHSKLFDCILIVIHPDWFEYLTETLSNYSLDKENIQLVAGGKERIDSIENALDFLYKNDKSEEDIVVIHDAVRPFVTDEILQNAVNETKKYGATVAISPAKDTMIISENGVAISMPNRATLFHGQAPDSFKFGIIYDALKALTNEERVEITGTAQICQRKGIQIHTYLGSENNIKITTISDLFLAKAIYKEFYR